MRDFLGRVFMPNCAWFEPFTVYFVFECFPWGDEKHFTLFHQINYPINAFPAKPKHAWSIGYGWWMWKHEKPFKRDSSASVENVSSKIITITTRHYLHAANPIRISAFSIGNSWRETIQTWVESKLSLNCCWRIDVLSSVVVHRASYLRFQCEARSVTFLHSNRQRHEGNRGD